MVACQTTFVAKSLSTAVRQNVGDGGKVMRLDDADAAFDATMTCSEANPASKSDCDNSVEVGLGGKRGVMRFQIRGGGGLHRACERQF